MKCPYKYHKDCKEVDTSGMTKIVNCTNCDWFNNGVRESSGIIIGKILESIFIWIKGIFFFIGIIFFLIGLFIWFQIRLLFARIKSKKCYQIEYDRQYYMFDRL